MTLHEGRGSAWPLDVSGRLELSQRVVLQVGTAVPCMGGRTLFVETSSVELVNWSGQVWVHFCILRLLSTCHCLASFCAILIVLFMILTADSALLLDL